MRSTNTYRVATSMASGRAAFCSVVPDTVAVKVVVADTRMAMDVAKKIQEEVRTTVQDLPTKPQLDDGDDCVGGCRTVYPGRRAGSKYRTHKLHAHLHRGPHEDSCRPVFLSFARLPFSQVPAQLSSMWSRPSRPPPRRSRASRLLGRASRGRLMVGSGYSKTIGLSWSCKPNFPNLNVHEPSPHPRRHVYAHSSFNHHSQPFATHAYNLLMEVFA